MQFDMSHKAHNVAAVHCIAIYIARHFFPSPLTYMYNVVVVAACMQCTFLTNYFEIMLHFCVTNANVRISMELCLLKQMLLRL